MARPEKKLRPMMVARTKKVGMYSDGGGLYLQIKGPHARSWVFRYGRGGRERFMGLGPVDGLRAVNLEEARAEASKWGKLLREGLDPIEEREREREQRRRAAEEERLQADLDKAKAMTFDQCADAYIKAQHKGWRNVRHAQQWKNTLQQYCSPVFGDFPVAVIDTDLVLKVLVPLWSRAPETASRLRGRIERVLSWATFRGHRSGDNPARWRGHLSEALPKRQKAAPTIPY
jgi:Arm DNA-binding domain